MLKLIRGARVFAPEEIGVKDVLVCAGKIIAVEDEIEASGRMFAGAEIVDGRGLFAVPGFVDCHVHIIGGGGEGGFASKTPEVNLSDVTMAGVTTVVGVLGTDGETRHMESLLSKARALEEEGVTSFIYTGAYQVPPPTICGSVRRDIINIDKVIGCGEVAISDHRSAYPTKTEIAKLAAEARVGGMLSGKAGVLHLHVGDGRDKLRYLHELADDSEIPVTQFHPTHVNRTAELFDDAVLFAKKGGVIDITACISKETGVKKALSCARAMRAYLDKGAPAGNITMSSDGNGAMAFLDKDGNPCGMLVAKMAMLHGEFKKMIAGEGLSLTEALTPVTANPARHLKLKGKGRIAAGNDADVLFLDDSFDIVHVMAKGTMMVKSGKPLAKGAFEI